MDIYSPNNHSGAARTSVSRSTASVERARVHCRTANSPVKKTTKRKTVQLYKQNLRNKNMSMSMSKSSFSGLGISGGAVSTSPSRASPAFPTSAGLSRRVARVPPRGTSNTTYPRKAGSLGQVRGGGLNVRGGARGAARGGGLNNAGSSRGGGEGLLAKGKSGVGRTQKPQGAVASAPMGGGAAMSGPAIPGAATLVVVAEAAPCKLRKCMGRRGCMCPKKAPARPKAHANAGGGGMGVGGKKMINTKARVGKNEFDPGPFGCDRCGVEVSASRQPPLRTCVHVAWRVHKMVSLVFLFLELSLSLSLSLFLSLSLSLSLSPSLSPSLSLFSSLLFSCSD